MVPGMSMGGLKRGWALRTAWAGSMIVMGVVYFYSFALYSASLLSFYCESECEVMHWTKPMIPEDKLILSYIRNHVLDPFQERVSDPPTHAEIEDPSWKEIGNWDLVHDVIRRVLSEMRNGVFVEVGAGNGVLLSHTVWLEVMRNWTGLLIEPRLDAYQSIRSRRKAKGAQVCTSDFPVNKKDFFWTPAGLDGLTGLHRNVTAGQSTLLRYVNKQDVDESNISAVQCFTLNALVWAALGRRRRIDLLVVHTMGGEQQILDSLEDVQITMLIAKYSNMGDLTDIPKTASRLDLVPYTNVHEALEKEFGFFINKDVQFVAMP